MLKPFQTATHKFLNSSQIIFYKLNSPSIEDLTQIYKQSNTNHFVNALKGYVPGKKLPNGNDILHHFNFFYDKDVIKLILENVNNNYRNQLEYNITNLRNSNGETALVHISNHYSTQENSDKTLADVPSYQVKMKEIKSNIKKSIADLGKLYIQYGVDVNLTDIYGNTAIYYALKNSNYELAFHIVKSPNFNPSIKFREAEYKDIFDLSLNHNQHIDLSIAIFLTFNEDERLKKWQEIKDNLYLPEALILACEKMCERIHKDTAIFT